MNITANYGFKSLRTSTVLTNSYIITPVMGLSTDDKGTPVINNQLILYVDFTKGSLTTAELIVEFSDDNVTWFQETYDNITPSTGIVTETPIIRQFGATGKFRIPIRINDQYIRVSVKGTGTVTGSLVTIGAILGYN